MPPERLVFPKLHVVYKSSPFPELSIIDVDELKSLISSPLLLQWWKKKVQFTKVVTLGRLCCRFGY